MGKPGGGAIAHWVLEDRGGSGQVDSGIRTENAFLVLKAEFAAAGNDRFTLYANPMPGGAEPLTGTVKNNANVGVVSSLTIYSTGAMRIDEIRVGETFADVTPIVPEPAGLAWRRPRSLRGGALPADGGLHADRRASANRGTRNDAC